jgi:5,10-methylenetetrahydromethanopterin reductase
LLTGQSGGYNGKVYQIAEHVRTPYPLPAELPPILIGTWGPKLAALAGEIADEVKVGGSANPALVPKILEHIRRGEQRARRTPGSVGLVLGAVTVVDSDRAMARQAAKRSVALYLPVVARLDPSVTVEPELLERISTLVNQGQPEQAGALISDELLDLFAFAGNPNDIIRQAEALFETGVRRLEFGTPHGLSPQVGLQLIGEQVLPHLR